MVEHAVSSQPVFELTTTTQMTFPSLLSLLVLRLLLVNHYVQCIHSIGIKIRGRILHSDPCDHIQSLKDCQCGTQPCNYCIKCPCYGCLSQKSHDIIAQLMGENNPITTDAVALGRNEGSIDDVVSRQGGSFVPARLLDEEDQIDMNQCLNTEQECVMLVQLHELVNTHRERLKLSPVDPNIILTDVAQRHSCFLAKTHTLSHSGENVREYPADQKKLNDHVVRAGYQYTKLGENVAAGHNSAQEVFQAWIDSPSHRLTIETSRFTALGLGLSAGPRRNYWTQVFAQPRSLGVGGDGPTEQHDSTVDVAGRYDSCGAFAEQGKVKRVKVIENSGNLGEF